MATPSRRDTVFPGSSSGAGLKRHSPTNDEDVSRFSASQIPQIPEEFSYKRRARPPGIGRPLKVNPNSQQFTNSERALLPDSSIRRGSDPNPQRALPDSPNSIRFKGDPWRWYFRILTEENNGQITIAYKQSDNFPIVAIKQQSHKDEESIKKIVRCSHANIVSLQECFVGDRYLYFVYETMEVSLAEIQATPYGAFEAYHIAVICQKVIHGIQHIHKELKILHGSISANSVVLDRTGCLKIADIGLSMLSNVGSSGNEQRDYRALGLLMVRLMELGTSLLNPDVVELKNPKRWNEDITGFLTKTTEHSGETLLKDDFMKISPQSGYCLKPLVRRAMMRKTKIEQSIFVSGRYLTVNLYVDYKDIIR